MEDTCTDCGDDRETGRYGICTPCATARVDRIRDEIRDDGDEDDEAPTQTTFAEFELDD